MIVGMRITALLLALTSASYARSICGELSGVSKLDCEAGVLLNQGIELFQKKEYDRAQRDFQRLIHSYPQTKEAVARASFYDVECDRLRPKPRKSSQVLKFKSETSHGQILAPGEKPPASTLDESQKDLTPGSTKATPPAR